MLTEVQHLFEISSACATTTSMTMGRLASIFGVLNSNVYFALWQQGIAALAVPSAASG